jgi:methylenetetrahydrofolate dehydrogenase (NADP+)/methenyltetrahydrofolate cyclohydrolase
MILNGRKLAADLRRNLRVEIEEYVKEHPTPGLDVVLVGDDPASQIYVRSKAAACERAGIRSRVHRLPATTSQEELEQLLLELNADNSVDGILVQLPLPKHLDSDKALYLLDPDKDVDGLHPINLGRLLVGEEGLQPCTPLGCIKILEAHDIDLKGKHAVVIGRSKLVGKPVALMLLARHATVTICHSRTADLAAEVRRADVVVAAVGVPELVKGSWLKEGAVVIDVGINRLEDESLVGDVEYQSSLERAGAITPVPGGVGPMTIATLLLNTFQAARRRHSKQV